MATEGTGQLRDVAAEPADRLRALERMPFATQLTALLRGEYSPAEWRQLRTPAERLEVLCRLSDAEQIEALRARCFSLDEWCAFARRAPGRVCVLNGEWAFITVTTPEWCER